jgi:hypothetical protein
MRKINITLSFLLVFIQCRYHFLPDRIEMPKANERMQSKKIALIGFCGVMDSTILAKVEKDRNLYQLLEKENKDLLSDAIPKRNKLTDYEKQFDYNFFDTSYLTICANDFKEKLAFGKPLTQFKEKGIARDIPADKVKSFIVNYLEEVKIGGQKEILELVTIKDKNIKLKEREVDYYVIGILKPEYQGRRTLTIETTIKYLLTIGSLMLVPWFRTETAPSKFLVYDNKLNLVKKFEYKTKYTNAGSSWITFLPSSESQPIPKYNHILESQKYYPQVYGQNDMATFSKDFQEFIMQAKDKK